MLSLQLGGPRGKQCVYCEAAVLASTVPADEPLMCCGRSNITHRDLKLENLLLQRPASADEPPAVKIADFGLAKKMAESSMQTICGTPQYVAPEVVLVRGPLPKQAPPSLRWWCVSWQCPILR